MLDGILLELLAISSFIAVFVTALVEVFKRALPAFPTSYIPLIALLLGIAIGALASVSFPLNVSLAYMLWGGAIAGLSSVGLFEGVKQMAK